MIKQKQKKSMKGGFFNKKVTFKTSEVIPHNEKKLFLDNVSIHINFYQNRLINEFAGKNLAKISEGCKIFFVRW